MTSDKTVMIVEDEYLVALDIGDELADRGWRVTEVLGTVEAAQTALAGGVPDVAILDVNLRGEHSFDLAADLRAKGATVVFLSGNTIEDLPEGLQDCIFVNKPVGYDTLHQVLVDVAGPEAPVRAN